MRTVLFFTKNMRGNGLNMLDNGTGQEGQHDERCCCKKSCCKVDNKFEVALVGNLR